MNREQKSRVMDEPEECYIRLRLVRGGRFVGARIFRVLGMLQGEIDTKPADVFQIWHAGEFITEAQYNMLIGDDRRPNPWHPVHMSDAGLAERVREAEEQDYWFLREIR